MHIIPLNILPTSACASGANIYSVLKESGLSFSTFINFGVKKTAKRGAKSLSDSVPLGFL